MDWVRPWSYRLRVPLTKSVRKRIRKAKPVVRKYIDKNGKTRVCKP